MDLISQFVDLFLHLDRHLKDAIDLFGPWTYVVLFAIIFCETGLVVTPILPGDSLLFAAGALAALGGLNLPLLIVLLIAAAVLGDAVNYAIGHWIGPRVFHSETSRFLNKKHLEHTQRFYEKYGAKTIVIARFVPIVRTFAPFVAGIGRMSYARFGAYNIFGAVLWVLLCVLAGYWFGNIPWVQKNFSVVILAIIFVSILPMVVEVLRARREARLKKPPEG